ncbi:MAG: hypothetical protein LQ349_007851 [Xanthoria aureola]|nr:MAG: hypothetical protein LQ349_007851 [Xanthoria aureola]
MSEHPENNEKSSSSVTNNHVTHLTQHPKLSASERIEEDSGPDDANRNRDTDIRKKQVFKGRYLFWLAYQSVGVIYGDIGTSPLYVYSSTFSSDPSYDDLLGALSLIIWTVTLMVSIKYVLIVLRADDEGEGGTFAIYSLLARYANIARRDPREERSTKMERVDVSSLPTTSKLTRSVIEGSAIVKTASSIGPYNLPCPDGILTPAQSVLGAIQGLRIVDADISTATIVGVSCSILVLLFLVQPFGDCFAPIVILWLGFNLGFGIYNLTKHDHSVLKAFSPSFAVQYLLRNKTDGWKSLGGILLAFTGVEALFADLGAFTRRAIQMSWLCFAYPCLLLAYIGQAAYISDHPEAYSNPFFNAVPPGMFYPSLVVAVLAAVVASQTMVTATFQLLSQIIKLSYFPQVKLVHTSKIFHGQIYIPWVNWLLMVGTIVVTVAYNNTTKLGQAYGVCVILVTFITTSMVSLVALIVWRVHLAIVLLGFLVFGALDGVYLSSALTKVPEGAWFTLVLAVLLSSIFVLWRFGKENQWQAEASDRFAPSEIIDWSHADRQAVKDIVPGLRFTHTFGSAPISAIKGMGIFFDKSGLPNTTPIAFVQFLQKFQAAPAVVVFFHIRPLSIPTVPLEERFAVNRCLGKPTSRVRTQFFRITLRHGYTDEVVDEDLGSQIYGQLRSFLICEGARTDLDSSPEQEIAGLTTPPEPIESMLSGPSSSSSIPASHQEGYRLDRIMEFVPSGRQSLSNHAPRISSEQQERVRRGLLSLVAAYEDQTVYIVGKEQMRIREVDGCELKGWCRRIALAAFLWLRSNTGNKIANLNVDIDKLVEIGFVKVI